MTNETVNAGDTNSIKTINGQDLKSLFYAGMKWLRTNHQYVNSLNVFPVPDGDTGTNMLLTMQAGYHEIENSSETNIGKVAHSISKGALLGARGNSGVILSQIWRGFARGLDSLDSITLTQYAQALQEAKNTAYKGVVRPVEGTILTVIKDTASAAVQTTSDTTDIRSFFSNLIEAADISVRNTPELLPVLKQAGVVDSGGKGLFYIFEGMHRFLNQQDLDTREGGIQALAELNLENTLEEIEPGQDYEIVIDFEPDHELDYNVYYTQLAEIGTSIQIGEGDGMYRMHIHVPCDKKYEAIDYTLTLGKVLKVYIENLMVQTGNASSKNSEINLAVIQPDEIAVVAVAPGEGFARIFASLGVAGIIYGGQTMNPSTEEILESFNALPCQKIIILPNNKNIIMAAQSASGLSSKSIAVIPSKNTPQGLSAMLRYTPNADFDAMVAEMNEAISEVDTCEITTATRSIEMNGVEVKEGEIIGLYNGKLIATSPNLHDTIFNLFEQSSVQNKERITFYYGKDIEKTIVEGIVEEVKQKYPRHELEIHAGGQPHYQFIIAIE